MISSTAPGRSNTAICLDECIHNATHALTAIELGACRIINIKLDESAATVLLARFTTFAMSILCRCGAEACSNLHRLLTTSQCLRSRTSRCREMFPPASGTGMKTSSSLRLKSLKRNHSGAN